MIPADISQSLTCKAGEGFALLATAEICCVVLLYLPGYTPVGREKLQLHNREQNKTEASSSYYYWERTGFVWYLLVQGMTGKAFLGKVFIPLTGNTSLWAAAAAASRLTPLGCASERDKKRALCFQHKEK